MGREHSCSRAITIANAGDGNVFVLTGTRQPRLPGHESRVRRIGTRQARARARCGRLMVRPTGIPPARRDRFIRAAHGPRNESPSGAGPGLAPQAFGKRAQPGRREGERGRR